jgi:hypothetical protein
MSLPCPIAIMPLATADAAPPLDPPGVWPRSHGFSVEPCSALLANQRYANAGELLRPTKMAPAWRRCRVCALSSCAIASAMATMPSVVAWPAWWVLILIAVGTPCSGPSACPAATIASATRAASSASSAETSTNAFSVPLTASIRSRQLDTTSSAETALSRMACAMRAADHAHGASVASPLDVSARVTSDIQILSRRREVSGICDRPVAAARR